MSNHHCCDFFADAYKSMDVIIAKLESQNRILREGLNKANNVIHDEFCSTSHHHFCLDAKQALTEADGVK